MPLSFVEQLLAARPRPRLRSNDVEYVRSRFPCLPLFFRRLPADCNRSRVIRMVTTKSDPKVQDHELTGFDLAISRAATAGVRSKILAKVSWRLAQRVYGNRI